MKASRQYQNRTAIIYFGPTKQDYLKLVKAESHRAYLDYAQPFLKEQLLLEMHHDDCKVISREKYTNKNPISGALRAPLMGFLLVEIT